MNSTTNTRIHRNTAVSLVLGVILTTLAAAGVGVLAAPTASAASGVPPLPLSTSGSKIVDATGATITLQGVNWFGFETANHAPHGLWSRDYKEMLAQIKAQGFNTIRMPFSLQAMASSTTSGIDYANGRNAALAGKTPQQVMDVIIDEAANQGLMIILDNHSQADDGFMYDLWYGQNGYTEANWVTTWQALAKRYVNKPNVIAADLKNEPHGSATWGTGAATDWRRAAELAGNAVLAQNPNMLIIVEGIEGQVAGGQKLDRHWWGGNLEGARANPVRLSKANKLVYSPHEYGPGVFAQPWFSDPNQASILADRWTKGFGYLVDSGTAPVLIGEFGAKNVGLDTTEGRWIRQFADYLGRKNMSWTFWAWNPNSGDTGGVLLDDWKTINTAKMSLLRSLINKEAIAFDGTVTPMPTPSATATPTTSPTATPTASPTASPTATPSNPGITNGVITSKIVTDSSWAGGWCGKLGVQNGTTNRIIIDRIEFDLSTGGSISTSWNGTFVRSGNHVTVTPPSWASANAGTAFTDTGVCVTGAAPAAVTATTHTVGGEVPVPTVTPTPAPTVTPTPTPTPTPTASTGSVIAVTMVKDSTWDGGYCRSVQTKNTGSQAINGWALRFSLPTSAVISQSWSGTLTRSGTAVTVNPAAWAAQLAPGQTVTSFGFCVTTSSNANGAAEPAEVVAG
ncbi:unannotated protein [freshwater metagenome]|uniref:cellulase n=1 Tax=freshwater metagenome TaxID=449393 RepID=A0A6J6N937_9ZZZZ|nr:cellulase family glycosylhydrolase [Actinomycetota bacterium]